MRKRRSNTKNKRGFIMLMLSLVVLTVLAGAGLAWLLLRFINGDGLSWSSNEYGGSDVQHIMVMGVDQRADDGGRSDTLMLVSVDKKKDKAAILSIPRDMRVAIEGNGYDKINHAYAFGGEKLTKKTLESVLGTQIDHYVLVDIKAFRRMIDAIGGVDLNVEKRMYYEDPWDDNGGLVIDLYPGQQHLDGERAMEYVRYRDEEGDVGRIRRQQKFMLALLGEVVSPQIITHLPELTKEMSSLLQTDMSASELTKLAAMLQQVRRNGVKSQIFSGTPLFYGGISYWIPNIVEGREQLAQNCGVELSEKLRQEGQRLAAKYEEDMNDELESTWKQERKVAQAEQSNAAKSTKQEKPAVKKDEPKAQPKPGPKQEPKKSEPAPKQSKKALKPEDITVRIVNNSGINGAAAEMAEVLRSRGFKVSETVTGETSAQGQSRIVVPAGSEDLFYGMPFKLIIVTGDANRLTKAELTVGKDYR